MFESVSPDALIRQGAARRAKVLPASLLVHLAAVGGAVLGSSWSVNFPSQPPAIVVAYNLIEPPAPPPPPPAGPPPPRAVAQVVKPDTVPPYLLNMAPAIIPDAIPEVPVVAEAGVPGGVEGGSEGGVAGGTIGGSAGSGEGGEIGGVVGGVAGPTIDSQGRVVVPRDEKLRMVPMSMVYPEYPENARLHNWEDQLVVRYVIGKDGRVREVTILEHALREIFDESTVQAIRYWRFRPMIRDGEAREVVHELTVFFRLE